MKLFHEISYEIFLRVENIVKKNKNLMNFLRFFCIRKFLRTGIRNLFRNSAKILKKTSGGSTVSFQLIIKHKISPEEDTNPMSKRWASNNHRLITQNCCFNDNFKKFERFKKKTKQFTVWYFVKF